MTTRLQSAMAMVLSKSGPVDRKLMRQALAIIDKGGPGSGPQDSIGEDGIVEAAGIARIMQSNSPDSDRYAESAGEMVVAMAHMNVSDMQAVAKYLGIPGASRMSKAKVDTAIRKATGMPVKPDVSMGKKILNMVNNFFESIP